MFCGRRYYKDAALLGLLRLAESRSKAFSFGCQNSPLDLA
jgi:hypothetical protein